MFAQGNDDGIGGVQPDNGVGVIYSHIRSSVVQREASQAVCVLAIIHGSEARVS